MFYGKKVIDFNMQCFGTAGIFILFKLRIFVLPPIIPNESINVNKYMFNGNVERIF